MPTFTLRPQTLADRLQALAHRSQGLARRTARHGRTLAETQPLQVLSTTTRWRALPATTRWLVVGAVAVGMVLLTMYVLTLQAAVERGESLREQRRQQGISTFGAGKPPVRIQTASPGSTRS